MKGVGYCTHFCMHSGGDKASGSGEASYPLLSIRITKSGEGWLGAMTTDKMLRANLSWT